MSNPIAVAASLLLLGCQRTTPVPSAAEGEPPPATAVVGGWHCTAYVSRATEDTPFTVEGAGPTAPEADTQAWERACAELPPTDPPGGCKVEAPPDGWSWTRVADTTGTAEAPTTRVVLTLTPAPIPYKGEGDATASQEEACAAAYVRACEAAGAPPGCEATPGYGDGGKSAVETSAD